MDDTSPMLKEKLRLGKPSDFPEVTRLGKRRNERAGPKGYGEAC